MRQSHACKTLVFCGTVAAAEATAEVLQAAGIEPLVYHRDLTQAEKDSILAQMADRSVVDIHGAASLPYTSLYLIASSLYIPFTLPEAEESRSKTLPCDSLLVQGGATAHHREFSDHETKMQDVLTSACPSSSMKEPLRTDVVIKYIAQLAISGSASDNCFPGITVKI